MTFTEKIEKNHKNFLIFNKTKYEKFQSLIPNNNIRRIVNSIPFLLCVNDKKIPGYVEGPSPLGIYGYTPDKDTVKYIESRFHRPGLNLENPAPIVQMLALLGSVATIAYTRDSDFDYWVCIDRKNYSPEELAAFEAKVTAIQNWAMKEINIEVHLFINDIDNIHRNIYAEDDDEAFGSTIGATLKDEFYRSSVIIAGKTPFWWVVPRINDDDYLKLFEQLPQELRETKFVDLGNLYSITKEDFLGAALFQLIKALGNPFKSILKIGILEKYLFDSGMTHLLCHKLKTAVHKGIFDDRTIDSYIILFEEVYDYYNKSLQDKQLLNILRQNLYFKINPQLSKYSGLKDSKNLPYRVGIMFDYVKQWGWTESMIKDNDNFDNWDYRKIITFWNQVKTFMLLSYQKISMELPALNLSQKISSSDFTLISRKIKSHFSANEGEIDQYVTFKETPNESILYIEPATGSVDNSEWRLYKRDTSEGARFVPTTLKTENDLVKLAAWAAMNKLYSPVFTRMQIQSGYSRINQNLITELMNSISSLFNEKDIPITNAFYLNPAFNIMNMVIINFNIENADSIRCIYHIYRTSWGQSFIKRYSSSETLVDILKIILNDGLVQKRPFDDYCSIVTPEPFKKLYKDIIRIYKDAYSCAVEAGATKQPRFTAKLEGKYISVSKRAGALRFSVFDNPLKALAEISLSPFRHPENIFFPNDTRLNVLSQIMARHKPGCVSVVYEEISSYVFIYLTDDCGNLFTFIKPLDQKDRYLACLFEFCKNTIDSVYADSAGSVPSREYDFHKMSISKQGDISFSNETSSVREQHLLKFAGGSYLSAEVAGFGTKEPLYDISSAFGSTGPVPLNQIGPASAQRGIPAGSSAVLTGLRFSGPVTKQNSGTTRYFLEKYKIELMLGRVGNTR